jgi:hypothetical protein
MPLSRVWVAMLTRDRRNAGTDSRIALIINQGGVDRLNHSFGDTGQSDQERGQANLYSVDVEGRNIEPEEMDAESIRIGILGSDAWRPEHIVVWGERPGVDGTEILPLAIETEIGVQLSTDPDEGTASFPLRPVSRGDRNTEINRLFLFMTTLGKQTGFGGPVQPPYNSASPLEIQVVSERHLAVLFEISDTQQDDLEMGAANFYSAPVIAPFTKGSLDDNSITLRIKGLDSWGPGSFFAFGLDAREGRPRSMVPLVHLPDWPHGMMEAESTTGIASVTLALAPDPSVSVNEVLVRLASLEAGQARLLALLEKSCEEEEPRDQID